MQDLIEQEKFEIEVLERMNSARLLQPLAFGGGSMLRLCHGLNRYSLDLDFWFFKEVNRLDYFKRTKQLLTRYYQITDAQEKFFTFLFEFRSEKYPRRLKIEIRKEKKDFRHQPMIAFSPHSTIQVSVQALTLEQMMRNKIGALLDREEIRDCFDIEFLVRRGIPLEASKEELSKIQKKVESFKERDFRVTLGSLLEAKDREYYNKNKFQFLQGYIQSLLSRQP